MFYENDQAGFFLSTQHSNSQLGPEIASDRLQFAVIAWGCCPFLHDTVQK